MTLSIKSKTSLTAGLTTCLLISSTVFAQTLDEADKTRYENKAIMGGAVVGAALGGPAGAIVSAGVGGWLGDKFWASKENRLLKANLEATQKELIALQESQADSQKKYEQAAAQLMNLQISSTRPGFQAVTTQGRVENQTLCCGDSELVLHFHSNTNRIESFYEAKLLEFVSLANAIPDVAIEISGHADRRGDSSTNLALSQNRVREVEYRLKNMGLKTRNLQTSAYGETRPLTDADEFENNFFDRRVVVRLHSNNNDLVTSLLK